MGRKPKKGVRKRRVRGSGALFYSPTRGVWVGRVAIGRHVDGTIRYVERSASTVEELQKKLADAGPPSASVTVREWCVRWLAEMRVRSRTKAIRTNTVNVSIVPVLGHLKVADLTPGQVERACQEWGRQHRPNTVRLTASVLRTAMSAAVRHGLRGDNPVSAARLPRGERTRVEPYSPAQLRAVIKAATDYPAGRALALLASTGMRVGEALALDVTDVKKERGGWSVKVEKTLHHDGATGPPKSQNGLRTLPIPAVAVAAVRAAIGKRKSGALFATENGTRSTHHLARDAWVRLLKKLGLPYQSMHKLRHSVATNLLASGYSLPNVARCLGDSVNSVVRTYLHADANADHRAALDRMLGG